MLLKHLKRGLVVATAICAVHAHAAQYRVGASTVTDTTLGRTRSVVVTRGNQSERDVDLYGTGVVDVKEITAPPYRILYTLPTPQGYARLQVEKRIKKGFLRAEFVLAKDGSRYVLVANQFRKFAKLHWEVAGVNGCGSGAEGAPQLPSTGDLDTVLAAMRIDKSCTVPPFQNDDSKLTQSVAKLMSAKSRDQLGSCMSGLGAGYYAGKLDDQFSTILSGGSNLFQCKSVPYPVIGDYDEGTGQITIDKVLGQGSPIDYGEIFFHESLHKAGISNEPLVRNIVACCYHDPASACGEAQSEMSSLAHETASLTAAEQHLTGFTAIMKTIESHSDELSADASMIELRKQLSVQAQTGNKYFALCMKPKSSSSENCSKDAENIAAANIQKFVTESCPKYFPDLMNKIQSDSSPSTKIADKATLDGLCGDLAAQSVAMVRLNGSQGCDGKAETFDRSCLVNTHQYADEMYSQMMHEKPQDFGSKNEIAPLLALAPDDAASEQRVQVMNSYLTSFSRDVKGGGAPLMAIFSKMKNASEDPDKTEAMIEAWFGSLSKLSDTPISNAIAGCGAKTPAAANACGKNIQAGMDANIQQFFTTNCPDYFTTQSEVKKVCGVYEKKFQDYVDSGVKDCKDSPMHGQQTVVGDYNFTCVARALEDGKACSSDYKDCSAKVFNGQALINGRTDLWRDGSILDKKTAAQNSTSGGGTVSEINQAGHVSIISFDPNDFGAMEAHVASVQKTLPNALASVSHAVSNLVMPEAQAAAVASPEVQTPRASSQVGSVASSGSDVSALVQVPASASSAPAAATHAAAFGSVFSGGADGSKPVVSDLVSASKQPSAQALGHASVGAGLGLGVGAAAGANPSGASGAGANAVGAGNVSTRASAYVADSKIADKSSAEATDGVSQALSRVAPFLGQLRDPAKAQAILPRVRLISHVQIIDCGVKSGSNDPYVKFVRTLKTDPFTLWRLDSFGKWLEQ
jgi:hypothetical protein